MVVKIDHHFYFPENLEVSNFFHIFVSKLKCYMKDLWFNIKFYLWEKPKDWYYNVKWFFKNLWRFRKQLWNYRTWDYSYCVGLFADSLEWLSEQIKNGHEEERSATKKSFALNELVMLLRKIYDDDDFGCMNDFFDGEHITVSGDEYHKEYMKRRNKVLNRIQRIIKGQDEKVFESLKDSDIVDHYDKWVELFDGTGYEGWWE